MDVTTTFKPADRATWRNWLDRHHSTCQEIWLILDDRPDQQSLTYLDAVEEAICFGWIDGIQKRVSPDERAQRFTPRKRGSHWTELNKQRARRLIHLGLMTDAGRAKLPDLNSAFTIAEDIVAALKAEGDAWTNFLAFPDLYRRVRIGYIEEMRKNPEEFDRRLNNFVKKTASNHMYGNWNDSGRLG